MLHPDLSLRKRQTILGDVKNQKLNPQRQVSRRVSMHSRGRSVSRALEAEPVPRPAEPAPEHGLLESIHSLNNADLAAQLEHLSAQAEEIEAQDQAVVRRNYETLVSVSRSVAELPPSLATLRKQVADLASITTALRSDAEEEPVTQRASSRVSRAASHRASEVMLNSAWRQDLVALFRKVEGAQKFLPPIPGRHMVADSGGWSELNAVTWTATKQVHMFVISDNLLVAAESTRSLVVDHCWPLADLRYQLRDTALQVQTPAGPWAYGAPNHQALDMVASALARSKAALSGNTGSRHSRTASAGVHAPTKLSSAPQAAEPISASASVEIARAHARELADLDLKIAKRDWAGATDMCLHSSVPGIKDRMDRLVTILLDLARTGGQPLALLSMLGRPDEAIEIYLTERARLIDERASDVSFRGDIVAHLSEVAVVYFEHIIATVRAYNVAFPAAKHAAHVVSWTKRRIEAYAEVFNRQLYNIRPGTRVYNQCVEITRSESAQLKKLGLDMDFLLDWLV